MEAEPAFAGEPGAFAALLEQFDRVFAFNHFGLGGKSRPLPWLQRNGPSFPALSSRAGYLLVKIASLWIIKDLSTDNDRTAHGQESKNASQHPDHCRLPIPAFSFLNATIVSMAARPVGRAMLVHECTFVIRDNIAFAMPFTACAGSRASEIMLHPSPGQDAEREGSESGREYTVGLSICCGARV